MIRYLSRVGFRRGVLGGSRAWTVVGIVAFALRALGRMAARKPEIVYREELQPGRTLVVSHLSRDGR